MTAKTIEQARTYASAWRANNREKCREYDKKAHSRFKERCESGDETALAKLQRDRDWHKLII